MVVDLRDAELARLELLNEALDPLFNEMPPEIELFDRGISRGDTPRLWIDAIAACDDGRATSAAIISCRTPAIGRKVLAESNEIKDIVEAVTHYVASRMIERERALAEDGGPLGDTLLRDVALHGGGSAARIIGAFVFGLVLGCASLFAALWVMAARIQP